MNAPRIVSFGERPMLIDSHAHIYLDRFENDLDAMIRRARDAGVSAIVMPAIDVASIHRAIELSEENEGLYAMAALHPSEVKDATDDEFEAVRELCRHRKVVAIGESGLDYYWDRSFDVRQQKFFRQHIRLAAEMDLPLVIHNRDATDDVMAILEEEQDALIEPQRLRGILHCFVDDAATAARAARIGFLIGIGGIVTFKNGGLDTVVREIPLEQIVLETDAPFLAPHPYRGKRNEPAYVRFVAARVAELKGLAFDEVAARTSATASALFDIPAP